ncbi:MAG: hypothetical protein EA377_08335 [Phycisphaerales bacterium]|nr:MAG: hypothetical protein EA377_08335 [Phycisphaerales bacterium]
MGILIFHFVILAPLCWARFTKRIDERSTARPAGWSPLPPSLPFTGDPRAVEVVFELERQRRFRLLGPPRLWTWRSFIEALDSCSIPRPRTIIDEQARPSLRRIPLPEHMLEPEGILESGSKPRARLKIAIGIVIVVAVYLLWLGTWWLALVLAAIIALQLPEVRDTTRLFRMDHRETVVGLGTVTDRKQRRWTVDDAVMLVKCTETSGPLIVTMIGEAGHLTLSFTDDADPDLVRLWQRWNHPQPRPELTEG